MTADDAMFIATFGSALALIFTVGAGVELWLHRDRRPTVGRKR